MKEVNITKQEFLKAKEYLFTCANKTSNGVTGYNFYLLDKKRNRKRVVGGDYWSGNKGYHWVTCWGTYRPLEILLSVGYKLGLKFHQIEQGKMNYI